MLYYILYFGVWSVFDILFYYRLLFFIVPKMARKRRSGSDKGSNKRKKKTFDLEIKMSVVVDIRYIRVV